MHYEGVGTIVFVLTNTSKYTYVCYHLIYAEIRSYFYYKSMHLGKTNLCRLAEKVTPLLVSLGLKQEILNKYSLVSDCRESWTDLILKTGSYALGQTCSNLLSK